MRIELSEWADADIVAMLQYGFEQFGWARAEAYSESFEQSFVLLRAFPLIGVLHEDLHPPIRSLHHRSHRIFYDIEGDLVVIQRILHHSMDAKRHLG